MSEANKEVAKTIFIQMGGSKFAAMTGAECWTYDDKSITFKIGKNCHKIRFFKVTLNGCDLYDLEFYRIYKSEKKLVKEYKNIFFDQLQGIFTTETGMYTHL
jgi:hypothetical protein